MTPRSDPSSTNPARGWWPALVCGACGFAVFQFFGNANRGYIDTNSLFYWWSYQWVNQDSETQHGLLILGLSLWLFVRSLRRSHAAPPSANRVAVPPANSVRSATSLRMAFVCMAGGLALHAVGFAVQQARFSIVALLIFIWGVVWLIGGRRWARAALFPLGFMVFAIPLNVLDTVGFWLRMWVLHASSAIAHGAGIGVVQNGTQLLAPDGRYQYDVAAACSGVRSLMALAALSLLVGYLSFDAWWRRALLLLLCFPLVYVGNVARITSIIFAAQWGGQAWGERVHEVMGFGIFAIVLGGVLAASWALERFSPERAGDRGESKIVKPVEQGRAGHAARARVMVVAGVALLTVLELTLLDRLNSLPPRGAAGVVLAADGKNPAELPTFLGTEWIGRRVEVSAVERQILPADTGFARKLYVPLNDPSGPVFLSIVLSGRDRTSIHRPELCLVGQGWTIVASERVNFSSAPPARTAFPATLLRTERVVMSPRGKQTSPELVVYWFVGGDRIASTPWGRMTYDSWNRLFHFRADRWAYVLMQTHARDGEAAALKRMQALLDEVLPVFQPVVIAAK